MVGGREMKNVYFVHNADEGEGVGVVATSHSKAKTCVYYYDVFIGDYIDLRCQKKPEIDASDMREGHIIPSIEGLKMGVYGHIEEVCPHCDRTRQLYLYDDGENYGCYQCQEKANDITPDNQDDEVSYKKKKPPTDKEDE
jgi:hypothetical protein